MNRISMKLIICCSLFSSSHCFSSLTFFAVGIAVAKFTYNAGAATLSLTSEPQSSGVYCPGPVTFTCVGTEIGLLFWNLNDRTLATYAYRSGDEFPLTVPLNSPPAGVTVTITNAFSEMSLLNLTSVLIVDDVSVLNDSSVQCEEPGIESAVFNIIVEAVEEPPPASFNSAFLPSPRGANVSLQWSPSFTSQYAVERYRVSVNPDPSSCSSDQVSPSEDYSCSGLVLGTHYTFTISAINCGDQEGERDEYDALLCEDDTFLVIAMYTYEEHGSELTSITTEWPLHITEHYGSIILCPGELNTFISFNRTRFTIIRGLKGNVLTSHYLPEVSDCNESSLLCSVTFPVPRSGDIDYVVNISLTDQQYNKSQMIWGNIDQQFNYTVYDNDRSIYAICSSQVPEVANCSVQYTTDYTYNNLSSPIFGPVNVPFVIAPLAAITADVYYHQVTLLVNSTFRIVIRSRESFITTGTTTPITTTNHISSAFPGDVTPLPPVIPLGVVGGISGALLVALALSMVINVMFIFKMKKSQAAGVEVPKAMSSSTNQCALEETADYTSPPIELETKHVDSDAESVVYDEVQEIRSRACPPTSSRVAAGSSGTPAAAQELEPVTQTQFQLTVNSAYSTPVNKI